MVCISKQKGQNATFIKRNRSKYYAGRSMAGEHGYISKQEEQNAEFRKQNRPIYAGIGQGQGSDMVVSANRKGRLQSSESRTYLKIAGRSRAGDRHGCISKQEGQNAEFRKRNRSKDYAGRSRGMGQTWLY